MFDKLIILYLFTKITENDKYKLHIIQTDHEKVSDIIKVSGASSFPYLWTGFTLLKHTSTHDHSGAFMART